MQMHELQQQRQHRSGRRERGGHTAFVMFILAVSASVVWLLMPV